MENAGDLQAQMEAALRKQKGGQDEMIRQMQATEDQLIWLNSYFAGVRCDEYLQPELDQMAGFFGTFITRAERLILEAERLRDRAVEVKAAIELRGE